MDQNAPAPSQQAPQQLAKQISFGGGDGSIFSQLTANPFFTAVALPKL